MVEKLIQHFHLTATTTTARQLKQLTEFEKMGERSGI
jgi:hypothetical protein